MTMADGSWEGDGASMRRNARKKKEKKKRCCLFDAVNMRLLKIGGQKSALLGWYCELHAATVGCHCWLDAVSSTLVA